MIASGKFSHNGFFGTIHRTRDKKQKSQYESNSLVSRVSQVACVRTSVFAPFRAIALDVLHQDVGIT